MKKTAALLLAAGMLSAAASDPAIADPSFENGQTQYRISRMESILKQVKPGKPDERFGSRIDSSVAHTGSKSLFFTVNFPEGRNHLSFGRLPCGENREYEFTLWYLLKDVQPEGTLWCDYWCFDKDGKLLKYANGRHYDVTPDKWHRFRVRFFTPKNCRTCSVTIKFCGRMKTWVDDAEFRQLPDAVFPKSDGLLLVQTPDFTCYADRSYFQMPETGLPENLKPGKEVELSAAGNEAESFQLVLNSKTDRKAVSAKVSDLACGKNHIPAAQTEIRRVEFAGVIEQPNPRMGGRHADPLVEFNEPAALPAGKNLGLYLTVRVPARTPKGIYRGKVTLTEEGKILAEIPLAVIVRGFSLPDRPALTTFLFTRPGFSVQNYPKFDSRPISVAMHEAQKLLSQMRVTGNQAGKPEAPKWAIRDGHVIITDWKPFDDSMEKLIREYHFSNFTLPGMKLLGSNAGWSRSPGRKTRIRWKKVVGAEPPATPFGGYYDEPVGLGRVIDYLKAFLAHAKEKYPQIDFYYYLYDEVPFDVYKDLAPIVKNLTAAVPELKIMLVAGNYGDQLPPYDTKVSPLDGASVYAPARNFRQHWYYQFRSSIDPAQYLAARSYPWQVYAAGGSGALLWSTMFYGHGTKSFDPWTRLGTTFPEPVATIFYPPYQGKGGVVPSIRAWQMRDGIEDFDYLKLLEAKKGREYVLKTIAPLISDPLVPASDHRVLEKIRETISAELEQ